MADINQDNFPLVKDKTTSQSESIQSVLGRLEKKRVFIPDYQRDAEQWDIRKKTLFIESLLNNLTIPAFFFCEDENNKYEVVDGQQRLTTIESFYNNEFELSDDQDIDYLIPQAIQYRGKRYEDLTEKLKNTFDDYPLTIIYLPKNIDLSIKLEIFRRINEGGTPLTGQDIRLAYYSQSESVIFIRLSGIHDNSVSAERMIRIAQERSIDNPWEKFTIAKELWDDWWKEKEKAKGQTPSLMFLWYLVCLDRNKLKPILDNPTHLNMIFRGTLEDSLDIYCSQLKYQEVDKKEHHFLSTYSEIKDRFDKFAYWIEHILSKGMIGISVDKYKQLGLFIAACVELNLSVENISDIQWNFISKFIREPRKTGKEVLPNGENYPEPRRWQGKNGQEKQFEKAIEILNEILTR